MADLKAEFEKLKNLKLTKEQQLDVINRTFHAAV